MLYSNVHTHTHSHTLTLTHTHTHTQHVALSKDGAGIVSGTNGYAVIALSCRVLLTVDTVEDMHEGTYRCRHNSFAVNSQAVQLTIASKANVIYQYPPLCVYMYYCCFIITQYTHTHTAIRQSYNLTMSPHSLLGVGQSVTFTCIPEGPPGNVMESLSWRFMSNITGMSGTVVDPRVTIEDGGRRLVITDLTVDFSGVWSCVASDPLTSAVINSLPLTVEGTSYLRMVQIFIFTAL